MALRTGVGILEFPPTPVLLSKDQYHRNNILVGNDPTQIRFVEQLLGISCQQVDAVHDEDLLKDVPTLYQVLTSKCIDLSPQVRMKVGVWSLSPITKGSAGANSIIKAATELLGVKLERPLMNRAADLLVEEDIGDIRSAFWRAVWIVAGDIPEETDFWKDPWTLSDKSWIPKGTDPQYRLNSLYRELVGYVFVIDDDEQAARKFGISPSKIKHLKGINLPLDQVYDSIKELSRWRQQKYNPYICALKIRKIWKNEY